MGSKAGEILSLVGGLAAGILCLVGIFPFNRFAKPEVDPDTALGSYTSFLNIVLVTGIILGFLMAGVGVVNIAVNGTPKVVFGIIAIIIAVAVNIFASISVFRGTMITLEENDILYMAISTASHTIIIGAFTLGMIGGILSVIAGKGE